MIERPTLKEIDERIAVLQQVRDRWEGNPYCRALDIELHALRLLLLTTRIFEEETNIAKALGIHGETDHGGDDANAAQHPASGDSGRGAGALS
jgi:hypothetical protein